MLLLPFLPITALIIQNSTTLNELLQYQTEVQRIGDKVKKYVDKNYRKIFFPLAAALIWSFTQGF